MRLKLVATASFGLEAVVKREIQSLGYEIISTENGHIKFWGDERAIVRGNLWLRSADRLMLLMGEFDADTFEELFQQAKGIAWEELIPLDGRFTVIGTSAKSVLHSVPACQSIVKKAIVERMKDFYGTEVFQETGAEYKVKFSLLKDHVLLMVDTSGVGLHKRGYRTSDVAAPIKETLAAAMVSLSFWKEGRLLVDPCCGSGTIPIEAALICKNIAPGLYRSFPSEEWELIDKHIWKEERISARKAIKHEADIRIYAADIDSGAVTAAKENADRAGVSDCIDFKRADITSLGAGEKGGIIITNPPYGARIGDRKQIKRIYSFLKNFYRENPTWSLFMITSDRTVENKIFGRKADRRRKLFNGRMEVCYYQFHGEKF